MDLSNARMLYYVRARKKWRDKEYPFYLIFNKIWITFTFLVSNRESYNYWIQSLIKKELRNYL